ncbi:MAG: hypothetical protein DWG76_00150 [Chloroflexi bacterium]|nr:hypothetical protein [Chloroflexota bacterium]
MRMKRMAWGVWLAAGLLSSCGITPDAGAESPPAHASETNQSIPAAASATPRTPEKDAPSPTMQRGDCLARRGEVEILEIESQFLDAGLRFRVYTPPCYAEQAQRSFPVLYLIHGQTFNDDQWDRLGADETADQLISAGDIAPFLIVMPYDRSSAQPAVDQFGEAVIEELLPWIAENYRTLEERDYRAVGGLSRGASWALHFGMLYPQLFGAMAGHSPPVFVEDAGKVRGWLDGIDATQMPRIWLDIGERDRPEILNSALWFEGLLNEKGIPHEWHLFPGAHTESYWMSHTETYLRWYAQNW